MDAAWYLNRLAVMGPRELLHRLQEVAQTRLLRYRRMDVDLPSIDDCLLFSGTRVVPDLEWDDAQLREYASPLLSGVWHALGYEWCFHDDPHGADWHVAPDTARRWPSVFFSDIHYRHDNPTGEIRVTWEPARLQQLVALAALSRHSSSETENRASTLIERQLMSWSTHNPAYVGVHYVSAMECALRIIAISHTLHMTDTSRLSDQVKLVVIRLLSDHAYLIERRLSLYSSAGNHSIAEAVGLLYAALLLPRHRASQRRLALARALLSAEAPRQILPDGGAIEQSLGYGLFVVQLCDLAERLTRSAGQPGLELQQLIEGGYRHLSMFGADPQSWPALGDQDGGWALSRYWRFQASSDLLPQITFPDAGISVYSKDCIRLTFDHGPLGMLPNCGHGHADALSLTLCLDGQQFLVDPGTHNYTGESKWRRYFKSTVAHNTLTLAGLDQADYVAPFQWRRAYRARLAKRWVTDGEVAWLAAHSGYEDHGIVHWRAVTVNHQGTLWIWDHIQGETHCPIYLHWHFHPMVSIQQTAETDDEIYGLARRADAAWAVDWQIQGVGTSRLVSGDEEEPLGWYAPRFGRKTPSSVISAMICGREASSVFAWRTEPSESPIDIDRWKKRFMSVVAVTVP